MRTRIAPILAAALLATACTINPVTGERQLALVSADDEIAIGQAQYLPSRQMQGGDYVRDPALTAYVRSVGQTLAAVSDRDLPYEFVVLNSSVPNAWALPGGKIAVNRGLLVELDSEAELAAVLGHEIVHAAARHGALAMQRGLLLQGAVAVAAAASRRGDYSGLAVGAASLGAELVGQRYSREAELEADRYGMRYMAAAGYDPSAAVSLQETFLRLAEGRSDQGWLAGLFASHPPSAERVAQNRATAASLPSGGTLGRDRYQAATADLRRVEPAYEIYDAGRAALRAGDTAEARRLADEAIARVADEGHFYALRGDVELQEGRAAQAIADYDRAIARNRNFFYYPLAKAKAHERLGQWTEAQSAYVASISLLPTADAYYGLGQLAERRGDRAAALEQYRRAAESSGTAGQAAQDAIVRLDLPANPGQYLGTTTALDSTGRLVVRVSNPTRLDVTDLTLVVRYADPAGQTQEVSRSLGRTLEAGASVDLATGLGPFASSNAYEVRIASASTVSR